MSIYYIGKPCYRCKNTTRYRSTRTCIVCAKMHNNSYLTPERRRKYSLKSKYNLTPTEHDALISEQNSKCAICEDTTKLHIDHDHRTGVVRGLLCHSCNVSLGHFRDNIQILEKAIKYLLSAPK